MRIIRLAICQISCHPALYPSHLHFLEEPFLPASGGPSLSSLHSKGLPVGALQALCLSEYCAWANLRLERILDHLTKHNVDIVIFPEGSIPIGGLHLAQRFSVAN